MECAVEEPRIRAIIALDATVRPTVNLPEKAGLKILVLLGKAKRFLTGKGLRLSMVNTFKKIEVASDPAINKNWGQDPRILEMWSSWPMPGAVESVIVDTIDRVHKISVPTLVLHGADDKVDPPETAHLLFEALTCAKQLNIIPCNGHLGHLDRNKMMVLNLSAQWALRHLNTNHMKSP